MSLSLIAFTSEFILTPPQPLPIQGRGLRPHFGLFHLPNIGAEFPVFRFIGVRALRINICFPSPLWRGDRGGGQELGRGSKDDLFQTEFLPDDLHYARNILLNVIVPEAQHSIALSFEPNGSICVFL